MKSIRIAALVACALAVAPLVAQSPMREGRWETTTQMEMAGLPMKMPPMTNTRCVTKEQVSDPNSLGNPPGGSCKTSDVKVDGSKVTWKMACTGQQAMTGDGEVIYKGDSYTGTINAKMDQGAMTLKLSGKRVGDC